MAEIVKLMAVMFPTLFEDSIRTVLFLFPVLRCVSSEIYPQIICGLPDFFEKLLTISLASFIIKLKQ